MRPLWLAERSHRPHARGGDRLGDVVGSAGLQAFLAVAFHGFGGEGDDRQLANA